MGTFCSVPRPVCFELAWATTDGFLELVSHWWMEPTTRGCGAFIFAKKVVCLRGHLRHWAKFNFGSIKLKKLALLHEIDALDISKETSCLSALESR